MSATSECPHVKTRKEYFPTSVHHTRLYLTYEMKPIQVCNLAYILLCIVGFGVQSWFIFEEYFQFIPNSDIAPVVPTSHGLPKLSLCFSLTSIIGRDKNESVSTQFFDNQTVVDYVLAKKTDELFAATPDSSDLLDMCSITTQLFDTRKKRLYREGCFGYYDVLKYQMLGYMCYRVAVAESVIKRVKTIDFQRIGNSIDEDSKLYSMSIYHRDLIGGSVKFLPIVHVSDMPYESRLFAMEFLSHPTSNNSFKVSFDLFRVTRLPPPYSTMCREVDPTECYFSCLSDWSIPLNIKPEETVLTNSSVRLRIVTHSDRSDAPTAQTLKHMRSECRAKCGKSACYQEFTVTSLVLYPRSKYKLGFRMVTAANPVVQIIFTPHMLLSEFLTNVGCMFGIWFAASALGLVRIIFGFFSGSRENSKWSHTHSTKLVGLTDSITTIHKRYEHLKRNISNRIPLAPTAQRGRLDRALDFLVQHHRICILCYNLLCIALFLYHIISVTELYFAYESLIQLSREVTEFENEAPVLVLCFDFNNLIHSGYTPIPDQYNFHQLMRQDKWMNYTLREMFGFQFPHRKVVHSCSFRNFTTNRLEFYGSYEECTKHFTITTIYMSWKMCYRITPKFNVSFNLNPIRSAFSDPFTIYSITSFLPEWYGFHRILPIVFQDLLPTISRNYALLSYFTEPNRTTLLSYASYTYNLLPKPYDTACIPNEQFDDFRYSKCVIPRTLKKLGHLPHSEIYTEPLDYKFLSYSLLTNKTLSGIYDQIESYCEEVMLDIRCQDTVSKTIASIEYVTDTNLTYAVQTPLYTTSYAQAVPRVKFSGFLFETACCFSFWFGLSIVYFNPFTHLILRSRRKFRQLIIARLKQSHTQLYEIIDFFKLLSRHLTSKTSVVLENFRMKNFFTKRIAKFKQRTVRAMIIFSIDALLTFCCLAQLLYLTEEYFAYRTVINTFSFHDKLETIPSSVLCLEINDIIKQNIEKPVTVATAFNMTPTAESFLTTCGGRGVPETFRTLYPNISTYVLNRVYLENKNPVDCSQFFKVKKFLMNTYICYHLKFQNKIKSTYNEVRALRLPGTMYDFGFDKNRTFDSYTALMTNDKPYISRLFTSKITSLRTRDEWVRLTYIKYTTKCLPFPYDQQGYQDMEFDECISLCMAKATKATGWIFPLVVTDDADSQMKILEAKNMFDPIIKDSFNRAYKECKSKCKFHRNCDQEFTYYVTISFMAGAWPGLSFWVRRTDYPENKIEFSARMRLCDWILDVGNITGIWLGLYMWMFNPFKFLRNQKAASVDLKESQMSAKLSSLETDYQEAKNIFTQIEVKLAAFNRTSRQRVFHTRANR